MMDWAYGCGLRECVMCARCEMDDGAYVCEMWRESYVWWLMCSVCVCVYMTWRERMWVT